MFTQILKGEKVSKERVLQILLSNFEKKCGHKNRVIGPEIKENAKIDPIWL